MTILRRRHARGRAGYSLVEVMVALTAGAILLSSTYLITTSSNRHFFRSSRVATTQASLRLAVEQLHADIGRAGFFGHPDTEGVFECGAAQANGITTLGSGAANTVRAVEVSAATASETAAAPAPQTVRHDRLTMTGNYLTNERYGMKPSDTTALDRMRIDPDDPGFRRSFMNIAGDNYNAAAFNNAFAAGRLVRVETYNPRRVFFRVVQSIAQSGTFAAGGFTADPIVVLEQPLPGGCPGLTATNLTDAFIAPLTTVDYQVIPDADDSFASLNLNNLVGDTLTTGAQMEWALIRREGLYGTGAGLVDASVRVVLQYALEFRLASLWCAGGIGARCELADLQLDTALTDAEPAELRGLRVSLAARTPERDPNFDPGGAFVRASPLAGVPLRSWQPTGSIGTGRARVRSTTFDVALMNNK